MTYIINYSYALGSVFWTGATQATQLSNAQQNAVDDAVKYFEDIVNVDFQKVGDDQSLAYNSSHYTKFDIFNGREWGAILDKPWIRIYTSDIAKEGTLGNLSRTGENGNYRELTIDSATTGFNFFDPGKGAWYVLLHELMHGMGVFTHLSGISYLETILLESNFSDVDNFVSAATPMAADIDLLKDMFGLNKNTRLGDDIYGFNAKFSGEYRGALDFDQNKEILITIYDCGGIDTLDASGFTYRYNYNPNITINLNPGGKSLKENKTFAVISNETLIENAITGAGADFITGNKLDNNLNGGLGADIMKGLFGDDRYNVDNIEDMVIELQDQGNDIVISSVNYTLPENVERIDLARNDGISATGNNLENIINGNFLDNILDGSAGADYMSGDFGDDIYIVDNTNDRIHESSDEVVLSPSGPKTISYGYDKVISYVDYTLPEYVEVLEISSGSNASAIGNEMDNELIGSDKNNILNGLGGKDVLRGGLGDDFYVINDALDTIQEIGDQGIDTVYSSVDYTLTDNVEKLIFEASSGDLAGVGNMLNNDIQGNLSDNNLDGREGADSLFGKAGNDIYSVDNIDDQVFESIGEGIDTVLASISYRLAAGQEIEVLRAESADGTGKLTLIGNEFANALFGNAGANTLDSGAGADVMTGLAGNDTYRVDNGGDHVVEAVGGGNDTVLTTISHRLADGQEIEVLKAADEAGTSKMTLVGNVFAQTINGNAGANTLDGGAGADTLIGLQGNDTYVVDNAADLVTEAKGGGSDRVFASTSYTLQAGQEIEGFQLLASTGRANLNVTGNEISQSLVGNNGNNVINGGIGRDAMTGRGGNDTYIVDNIGDRITESAGGGRDTVLATGSYALAAGQEIEALQLLASTGSARLNLSGNEFGQSVVGNIGANVLDGRGGADVLTGRGGADSFQFSTALGETNVDRITDFAVEDTIRLSKSIFSAIAPGQLAAGAFKTVAAISTAKLDADDRIVYKPTTGELFYDADGSGAGAAVKFAVLDNKAALTAADFLIV